MIRKIASRCLSNQSLLLTLENRFNHFNTRMIFYKKNSIKKYSSSIDQIESDTEIEFENDTTKLVDVRMTLYPTSNDTLIHKINSIESVEEITKFLTDSIDTLKKEQFLQVKNKLYKFHKNIPTFFFYFRH